MPKLQVWLDGWTAINSKGHWSDLREATAHEIRLAEDHPEGFWLPGDGEAYWALGARQLSDRYARVMPA